MRRRPTRPGVPDSPPPKPRGLGCVHITHTAVCPRHCLYRHQVTPSPIRVQRTWVRARRSAPKTLTIIILFPPRSATIIKLITHPFVIPNRQFCDCVLLSPVLSRLSPASVSRVCAEGTSLVRARSGISVLSLYSCTSTYENANHRAQSPTRTRRETILSQNYVVRPYFLLFSARV